jgi:hypothetical protein
MCQKLGSHHIGGREDWLLIGRRPDAYGCDACIATGIPLLEAADGRSLCLACVEAAPDLAGFARQAVEMLRTLTRIVRKLD